MCSFETEDGLKREESGKLQLVDPSDPEKGSVTVMRGSYSYTDPDGRLTSVTWVADENGFRPTGDHLPVA